MAPAVGIDPKDLGQAGWGIIFHERESPEIREALRPLLEHRRSQATSRFDHFYREFRGNHGFRDGENKEYFLAKNRVPRGLANPHRMPYYLLIVGDPKLVPFDFQQQLDIQYAVGRICFDTPEEYERYARSLVKVESGHARRKQRITLFSVRNHDDPPTELSTDHLVRPLAEALSDHSEWKATKNWEVRSLIGEEATKKRLTGLFQGEKASALIFTASHGMSFSCGDPLQRTHQGALLCQDWPGPKEWQQQVPPHYYFSAEDINPDAHLQGLIAFHFASYSAGTLPFEDLPFPHGGPRTAIASHPFVAHLPQRMLGHPNGGALAVIGQVGRVWSYSLELDLFENAIRLLMDSYPVGFAMESFNQRYAELAVEFTEALRERDRGNGISSEKIAELWMAHRNVQNLTVLGDPAVRVALT